MSSWKGNENIYSYAKLILIQKKDSQMVHDDIREEYLQSKRYLKLFPIWAEEYLSNNLQRQVHLCDQNMMN